MPVIKKKDTPARKSAVKDALKIKEMPEERIPDDKEVVAAEKSEREDSEPDQTGEQHLKKSDRYFEGVGRRKTAVARVRLFTRSGDFTVNGKPYIEYFPTLVLQRDAEDALKKMKLLGRFRVSVKTSGGGIHAQAEAVRLGLARCLLEFNPDFRKRLKRAGFLRRDPRMKERKKFGLKKARKAPQWAKR